MTGTQTNKGIKTDSREFIDYKDEGLWLTWPDEYTSSTLPEWRVIHFSLSIPFSPDLLEKFPEPKTTESTQPDTSEQQLIFNERFLGLKRIELPRSQDDSYHRPYYDQNKTRIDYKYTPTSFHKHLESRFGSNIAESLNVQTTSEHRAAKICFVPDKLKEADVAPSQKSQDAINPYRIKLKSQDDSTCPSFTLAAAELLSYQERDLRSFGKDTVSDQSAEQSCFLVLHVVVENVDSHQAEQVSQSLKRPRKKIDLYFDDNNLHVPSKQSEDKYEVLDDGTYRLNALQFCFAQVKDKLGFKQEAEISRGGYLQFNGGAKNKTGSFSGKSIVSPFIAVCAIPHESVISTPKHFQKDRLITDISCAWTPADLWAWQFSTGADEYYLGVPKTDVDSLKNSQLLDLRNWTVHGSADGFAFVRRGSAFGSKELDPMMLTGTRFLELAILNQRARQQLFSLSKSLRNLDLDLNDLRQNYDIGNFTEDINKKLDELDQYQTELNQSLVRFQNLQMDIVDFRDRLWFEAIPNRPIDTKLMEGIQKATNTTQHFHDLLNEMELRQNVYATHAAQLQVELDKAQKKLEDKHHEAQQRINHSIGLAALALSLPGLIALYPTAPSMGTFWSALGIFVLLASFGFFEFVKARNITKKTANEPRLKDDE